MLPLSKEEIERLKTLKLEEYAKLPILYGEEISDILTQVMPKLIKMAEIAYKKDEAKSSIVTTNTISILERNLENEYIQALEMDIEMLRNFYNHRTKVVIEVPWYKKLLFWIKGK